MEICWPLGKLCVEGVIMSGVTDHELTVLIRYNTDFEANALGSPYPPPDNPTGPCITGVIDLRDTQNPLEGFVIEDASVPWAIAPFMFTAWEHLPGQIRGTSAGIYDTLVKTAARLGSKFLGPLYRGGSVQKTAVYLIMSHDSKSREKWLMCLGLQIMCRQSRKLDAQER